MPNVSIKREYHAPPRPWTPSLRGFGYAVLTLCALLWATPLVWLVCAAFKKPGDMWTYTFMPYGQPDDKLVAVKGLPEGAAFVLTGTGFTVGSAADRTVRLPAGPPLLLQAAWTDGAWLLKPAGDAQTIAVNNDTKTEHWLKSDDVLHVAGCALRYEEAHTPTTRNFSDLFVHFNFGRYLLNSFFLTSLGTSISLVLCSLGGFALAKYNFKGKSLCLTLMLATMMIPGSVLLAPSYELICKMGLMNNYLGILLPGAVGAFGMLLFRQAMLGIPDDLLEAARIDGCSEFRIYWEIIMPVARPMSGAFCLMSFMGAWNSFLWPMIVLQSDELFTVPIALSQTIGLQGDNLYGLLMAGTLLGVIPPAVLFFLLQKEFIAGLTAGAVKG